MPLLLLLLLYLACLGDNWAQPAWVPNTWHGVLFAGLQSWAAPGLVILAAAFVSWRVRRRLRFDSHQRDAILRRYGNFRFYHMLALFVAYGVALYLLGWGWAVEKICSMPWRDSLAPDPDGGLLLLPGAELLLLLPLVLTLVLSWACFYDAERALSDSAHPLMLLRPFWSRSAYIGFHVRQNLAMVLVPVVMLIVVQGAGRLYPDMLNSATFQVLAFALLFVLIASLPWVLRLVLGLRPLPASELRDRLVAAARRLRFRCSDIMLWNTRNGVANALVVGLFPTLRYVVLTDRLLVDLTADEVEAVFGHEAGHVKHHHMLYYLGFLLLSMGVLYSAWTFWQSPQPDPRSGPVAASSASQTATVPKKPPVERLAVELAQREQRRSLNWETPLLIGSLGVYIFVVFGFLSRRCERQADIHGCRAVSCGQADCTGHDDPPLTPNGRGLCPTGIQTFIHALEKVAVLNGISRSKPGWLQSWQHSTIDRRVRFLQEMLVDPGLERRFQRRVGLVKWGLMLGLLALLCVMHWIPSAAPASANGTSEVHSAEGQR